MKLIVALEGQGYEANIESTELFFSLKSALMHYKQEYLDIDVTITSNINADIHKQRLYENKLAKKGKLMFEREGGFWLQITEKEVHNGLA